MSEGISIKEAVARWWEVRKHLHELERQFLTLAKHPDVTPDQLLLAHAAYQRVHISAVKTQAALHAKFKPQRFTTNPFTFGE